MHLNQNKKDALFVIKRSNFGAETVNLALKGGHLSP